MLTVAAFSVSLAWIIISASRHNTAVTNCVNNFFQDTGAITSSVGEGETLCNIFTWADVGLMGGLWVVLAIMQVGLFRYASYPSAFSQLMWIR